MTDNELLPIGRFAGLTGLTIHALRHYGEVGLLRPATVDPSTGYRRYSNDQVNAARLIVDLRWLDMPINDIRIVVETPAAWPGPRLSVTWTDWRANTSTYCGS